MWASGKAHQSGMASRQVQPPAMFNTLSCSCGSAGGWSRRGGAYPGQRISQPVAVPDHPGKLTGGVDAGLRWGGRSRSLAALTRYSCLESVLQQQLLHFVKAEPLTPTPLAFQVIMLSLTLHSHRPCLSLLLSSGRVPARHFCTLQIRDLPQEPFTTMAQPFLLSQLQAQLPDDLLT